MPLLIRGGTVVNADHRMRADVLCADGVIQAVKVELLTNAAEHAFPDGWAQPEGAHVQVSLQNTGDNLIVRVHDNGVGWPDDFDISTSPSLGLSIARSLVLTQLNGTIETRNDSGAVTEVTIPIGPARR